MVDLLSILSIIGANDAWNQQQGNAAASC